MKSGSKLAQNICVRRKLRMNFHVPAESYKVVNKTFVISSKVYWKVHAFPKYH